MNLFDQQRANRRRTWLVMGLFVGFLLGLGLGFDAFVVGQQGVFLPVGTLTALGVGTAGAVSGYLHGDRAVLLSSGAVPLAEAARGTQPESPDLLKFRQLDNIVEEMAIAAGLPKPAVYVIPDPDPNAFATGRDPQHAAVAVTKGLLDMLPREQLQGVIAHEMSHIRNYDIRLMTVVAALIGAIVLLADWSRRALRYGLGRGGRRARDKGGTAATALVLIVWLAAVLLAPLLGRLLAMAVSRRREYLADASAAQLTRNPGALADALQRIEFAAEPTKAIKRGTAHLCIADPLGRAVSLKEGFWADLFATHPPMVQRIAALRQMAYQHAV